MAGRTEAALIVDRLIAGGMQRAEIARLLGTHAQTVRDIGRGKNSGAKYLTSLRGMAKFGAAADVAPRDTQGTSTADRGEAIPTDGEGASDLPVSQPQIDAAEAPYDERTPGQKVRDSIKDALLGRGATPSSVSAPSSRKSSAGKTMGNDELVEQLVPIAALAVVVFSQAITPPRYVAVDPTHAEAAAMLTPLVRAMTRQMDAAGKLTETQLDLLQCLLAVGVYGQRAFATYRDIRAREGTENEHPPRDHAPHAAAANGAQPERAGRDRAAAAGDAAGRGPGVPAQHGNPARAAATGAHADQSRGREPAHDGVGQADPFASIYAADAAGRSRLGIN